MIPPHHHRASSQGYSTPTSSMGFWPYHWLEPAPLPLTCNTRSPRSICFPPGNRTWSRSRDCHSADPAVSHPPDPPQSEGPRVGGGTEGGVSNSAFCSSRTGLSRSPWWELGEQVWAYREEVGRKLNLGLAAEAGDPNRLWS